MNSELDIRLKAFNRSLGVLALPENVILWKDRPPEIFTVKQGEAATMAAALSDAAKQQETARTGITAEKDREETELEDAAHVLGQALALWFHANNREDEAAQVDFPISSWRQLRDQRLLTRSQLVIDLAAAAVSGPQSADAAKYGITAAAVADLTKERADYAEIVNAPGVAQAVRKALTRGFRPAFALVERKFGELDALILQFGNTPAGRSMIAAWKDARLRKGANGTGPTPAPAPPAPSA